MSSRFSRSLSAVVAACLAGALLVPSSAAASTSLVEFRDGAAPRYVAFDETSGRAYVALYYSVAVVDSATRAVVGEVDAGVTIDDLDVDVRTGAAYVAGGYGVTRIEASSVVGDAPAPAPLAGVAFRATRLAVSPELDRIFVSGFQSGRNGSTGHLASIVLSTGEVERQVALGSGLALQDLAVDPSRGRLYGTAATGVAVYDVATLEPVQTVPTDSRALELGMDRSRDRLYVTQGGLGAPTAVIDMATNTTVPALSLSGEESSMALAVDPERGRVFVARLWGMAPENSLRGTVDAFTEGVTERTTVRVGTQPVGLGVRPSTGEVWVADNADDTVAVLTVPTPTSVVPVTPTSPVPTPDRQGPTITVSSPLAGAVFDHGQPATVSFACTDPAGLERCGGSLIEGSTSVPVDSGAALDTTKPGSYLLRVLARDTAGNVSVKDVDFTVLAQPGDVIRSVTGGETVSTGATATAEAPLQTSIVVPAGLSGTVSVDAQPLPSTSTSGYTLFGQQLQLEGPPATADDPYTVTFTVDASVLGGIPPADVQVFRDGAALTGCTHRTAAVPDPCTVSRGHTADGSGDALVTVRTSHFSTWTLGRRTQGPLASVAAAPANIHAKAGAVAPGKVAPRR